MAAFIMGSTSTRVIRFYRMACGFSKRRTFDLGPSTLASILSTTVRLIEVQGLRSESKHVAGLHEELPAVVDVATGRVCHIAGRCAHARDDLQVFEVAVIADIDRGAGMDEVRDQEIGIEFA